MNRIALTLISLIACTLVHAQPAKWMKNASKGMATLYAIQQNGDTLQSPAFFIDNAGTLVAPFKTIQRAQRAWVEADKGVTYGISRICGFSSTYNVAKLQADMGKKKSTPLTLSKVQPIRDVAVYLMPKGTEDKVAQVEKAGSRDYYTLTLKADAALAGNPVMNGDGEVVAILQTPVITAKSPFYALDINFVTDLKMSSMDVNNTDLQNCGIRKQLPAEESQAKSFMYLCQGDNALRISYADDFIQSYPQSPSGYAYKAECQAQAGDLDGAKATYDQALKSKTSESHEILYSRSNIAYQLIVSGQQVPADWTLENALADIRKAYEQSPLPLYTLQEARILYSLKDYENAAQKFTALTQTNMREASLFIYIAQCRENLGASDEEILALNDSALACFTKPYSAEAADYLWLRATTLKKLERWRDAITDLNDYEHLMNGMLTDVFYYEREQIEMRTRMFAQALNDIQKAIQLNAKEPLYHAEKAVLLYRVNELDQAVEACRQAISLDDDFADAHRLLGICLNDKGKKSEAKTELLRAKELGDELADDVLQKLSLNN